MDSPDHRRLAENKKKIEPGRSMDLEALTRLLDEAGRLVTAGGRAEAEGALNRALDRGQGYRHTLVNLGPSLLERREFDAALSLHRLLVDLDRDDPMAQNALGVALVVAGQAEKARPVLEKAVDMAPDEPLFKVNLGKVLLVLGQKEPARRLFEASLPRFDEKMQKHVAELIEACSEPVAAKAVSPESTALNRRGAELLADNRLEEAQDCLTASLARDPDQPEISRKLLEILYRIVNRNAKKTMADPATVRPAYFDKAKERNPHRDLFLKYVPEHLTPQKTGLNILFISDMEVAGNQIRMMRFLNRRTTHTARNVILHRDYLGYGEDIVLDSDEALPEVRALIRQADFFHFSRLIPNVKGVDWNDYLNRRNCLVDYFGGDIKFNKEKVVDFHERTGIFGLNKYDHGMYEGAERLMYHFPTMFDASVFEAREPDLSFYEKDEIVFGHAPTDPMKKCTHQLLPVIERAAQRAGRRFRTDLIMGVSNTEAMRRKEECDIFIDLVRPDNNRLSGCPGQNSHESLALGKVTICSLDSFFMTFYPDTPVFSANLEGLEDLIMGILANRTMVAEKMKNARQWLQNFSPVEVMRRYLHLYHYVTQGNQYMNSFDRFLLEFE